MHLTIRGSETVSYTHLDVYKRQVGVITTTHGVRGEVKVFPTTDDPARFKKLKNVVLDTGKEMIDLEAVSYTHLVRHWLFWMQRPDRMHSHRQESLQMWQISPESS